MTSGEDTHRSGPPSWGELLTLMIEGPGAEPAVRGALRCHRADDEFWFAHAGDEHVVPTGIGPRTEGGAVPLLVWRDGRRLRIEEPDGTVILIADEHTCWQFDAAHEAPLAAPHRHRRYVGSGTELLTRRRLEEFVADGFTRPTGPVGAATFLGRPAWTVELAPPPHKPHPMQLVVDAGAGLLLQRRVDADDAVDEWVELVVGEVLDPELFTWTGPVRTPEDEQAELRADWDQQAAPGREWFAGHVSAAPLRVELNLRVLVHEYDDTGAFEATLGAQPIGMLARRPRSADPWDLRWDEVQHRWSTPRWDWALSFFDDQPSAESIEALRRQLDEAG